MSTEEMCTVNQPVAFTGVVFNPTSDRNSLSTFTVRAYPTYLLIGGDGIITKRIIGANPKESVVNHLVAIVRTLPKKQKFPRVGKSIYV